MRNWIVARSAARPMRPPRASTSRTTVPFAIPPIAGLQDIWPIVSRTEVSSNVLARDGPTWRRPRAGVATSDDDYVKVEHGEKLQSEDRRRLGHRRSSGPQSAGFGTIYRLANLSQQSKKRLVVSWRALQGVRILPALDSQCLWPS